MPKLECLFVVTVKGLQRCLQASWKFERVELFALTPALLGHVLADVLPKVAEHRHLVAGDVFCNRDARQFNDAALDGIHQREVAHRPREQRSLGVAGATQKKGVADRSMTRLTPSFRFTASR